MAKSSSWDNVKIEALATTWPAADIRVGILADWAKRNQVGVGEFLRCAVIQALPEPALRASFFRHMLTATLILGYDPKEVALACREVVAPQMFQEDIVRFAQAIAQINDDVWKLDRGWVGDTLSKGAMGASFKAAFEDSMAYTQTGSNDSPRQGVDSVPNRHAIATVLLCTATDKEDNAMEEYLNANNVSREVVSLRKGIYKKLAVINGVNIFWVRSGMGSQGSGGALATVLDAIDDVQPHYVISCGVAFGHDAMKQKIGDVLVSEWVRGYDQGRQEPGKFIPRGPRVPADPFLLQIVRAIRNDLLPLEMKVGGFLSGGKLVDDPEFKKTIWDIEPEAEGGDMEGIGVVDACGRRQRRWVVVKAICDWGENKNSHSQAASAANAIGVVFRIISSGGLLPR